MSFDNLLGLLVSVLLLVYLVYALLRAGAVLGAAMTAIGWLQILVFFARSSSR